jgi:hypothetical protein
MTDISLACVCYVGQPSAAKVQDVVRRLNKKNADARILLALLGTEAAKPMAAAGAEVCSGSFGAALDAMAQAATAPHGGAAADTRDSVAT